MAEDDVPQIHPDFARWYSAVALGEDHQKRHARWVGVRAIVDDSDRAIVEALIRLAFGTRATPNVATLQKIQQAFKDADETYDAQGNARELQVLAGACLAVLMEEGDDTGAAAALAVTTTAFAGARKDKVSMDLGTLADEAIDKIADKYRERPDLGPYTSPVAPTIDFGKVAAKVRESSSWDGVAQAFESAAKVTQQAFNTTLIRQAEALQEIETFLHVQDEELQMLWWLTGQRSWDFDCAFDKVPTDAQPLVFAKELADNTVFLPGAPSIKALLSRAGLTERKRMTIPQVINSTDEAWLQRLLDEQKDPSPISTPVHAAIKRRLETGAGEAWVAGWAATTGIDAAHTTSPLMLGTLFYRERLLYTFE